MSTRSKRKAYRKKVMGTAYSVAQSALNTALKVKRLINVEYKLVDSSGSVNPSTTPLVNTTNAMAEGTTSTSRNGISVRLKSLRVKGYYTMHASATNTCFRCAVVLDKSPNSATPTFLNIYESASVVSMPNNVTEKRFRILKDTMFTMSGTGEENGRFDWYFPLNHITKYTGSGGSNNDLETNQLVLVIWSNEATNTPTLDYTARVRYIDN